MAETFANNAVTTLSAGCTDVAVTIDVVSAALFPVAAQYRIIIDNEIMTVTAGAGTTTWTVTRGAESTTNVPHANGAQVTQILTAGAMNSLLQTSGLLTAVLAIDGTGSGIDADLLDGAHGAAFGRKLLDTAANIKASAAASYDWGLATDTLEVFWSDGSTWRKIPFVLVADTTTPDMGTLQTSSRIGIGTDYISDKRISNSSIGSNGRATLEDGDIRVSSSTLAVYLSAVWKDVVTGFRFREDDDGSYELEHMPIGFTWWYELLSGNSDILGLNGLPLIQNYGASMGAYPQPLWLDGGVL